MTVALCTGKFRATRFTLGTSVDVASGELVRFTPDSDRCADIQGRQFRAKTGLMHRSKTVLFDQLVGAQEERF
jgi:hypothetical protein